jgi:hypothetical protein
MSFHRTLPLLLTAQLLVAPLAVQAGSYEARCASKRDCMVKILGDRLIVDGKTVPVDAVTSWAKGGPGSQSNAVLGAGATILFGAPGLLAFGLRSFKSTFSIAYYTPEGEIAEIAFAFDNGDASRFFETEIQAATGLPIGKVKREAKEFQWKEYDYPAPR